MTNSALSKEEIRKFDRDLRILVATNGTLTRVLSVMANESIVVDIINQKILDTVPKIPELDDSEIGQVLQRNILLKGRRSGIVFVAAESLIAVDLLPPAITESLTKTHRPIGEVMAASCIETYKEDAKVWIGDLPCWLVDNGYKNSLERIVGRRYRLIAGGRPVIITTEYFLRSVFQDAPREEPDRCRYSNDIDTRSGDRFVLHSRVLKSL
ncbi:chorismate--pyruvate lyase [Mycobacterium uberis]|uniref:Chorismate--pyruvate lyase n=1 Tax=Mycobacterium uberis TaxID=2162698 RepID=A0A3E1HL01_9MYCO|nr:chorismate pyruvate-lyase family protein [Mycobacterium uberis]RFD27128.1 chorismate--pyruvate lyase [Mycobacterium uberis]